MAQVQACRAATSALETQAVRADRLAGYDQCLQVWQQEIFAFDVEHHALLTDLVSMTVIFHQAQILMPTVGGLYRAEEQAGLQLHYTMPEYTA